jgi:hypothetical protein
MRDWKAAGMIIVRESRGTRGQACLDVALSAIYPTSNGMGLNPELRYEKQATGQGSERPPAQAVVLFPSRESDGPHTSIMTETLLRTSIA